MQGGRVEWFGGLQDNYIYALPGPVADAVVLVDPGDPRAALRWLEQQRRWPAAVLVTHHHGDHVGGLPALRSRFPGLRVFGPATEAHRIPGGLTEPLVGEQVLEVGPRPGRVIDVGAHTRGHLAYFFADPGGGGDLFTGDALFPTTVGNLFEGTPEQLLASLGRLRALPAGVRVWPGHEYTDLCLSDTLRLFPDLAAVRARWQAVEAGRRPRLPLSLDEEREQNPFFRWDDPAWQARLGTSGDLETLRRLEELT